MVLADEKRWKDLAVAMRREVRRQFPDWTGGNRSDPGVTLLQLFGFLTESLLEAPSAKGLRDRASAARTLAGLASALAAPAAHAARHDEALIRNHYFYGRLLDADDYTVEQDYLRGKLRRHNRRFHGFGIVRGLEVSVERRGAGRVVIAPGFALDRRGEEIELPRETSLPLPKTGVAPFVLLRYAERLRTPIPRPSMLPQPFSRIEETFAASLATASDPSALTLARLTRATGTWALDPRFRPRRAAPPA